jgi:hypothetical protein
MRSSCTFSHEPRKQNACFECGSTSHIRPDCPIIKKGNQQSDKKKDKPPRKAKKAKATQVAAPDINAIVEKTVTAFLAKLKEVKQEQSMSFQMVYEAKAAQTKSHWDLDSAVSAVCRPQESGDADKDTEQIELQVADGRTVPGLLVQGEIVGNKFSRLLPFGRIIMEAGYSAFWSPCHGLILTKIPASSQQKCKDLCSAHTSIKPKLNQDCIPQVTQADANVFRDALLNQPIQTANSLSAAPSASTALPPSANALTTSSVTPPTDDLSLLLSLV